MWYFILYLLFAIWVFFDARRRRNNFVLWPLSTVILGPIVLPFYFAKRNLKESEIREGGIGWNVLKNFAILWTITLFVVGIAGMIGAGNVAQYAETDAEKAGAVIGIGLSLGLIVALWFFPMLAALVFGLFLKKPSVIEKGPTGKLAEIGK
jgi:hypothetical protein